jgi:hypothetical protein
MDLGRSSGKYRLGGIQPRPLRSMLTTMVQPVGWTFRSWPSPLFGKAEYLGSVKYE